MIPSDWDYYTRRAAEHRQLAQRATQPNVEAAHRRLAAAYMTIARKHRQRSSERGRGLVLHRSDAQPSLQALDG